MNTGATVEFREKDRSGRFTRLKGTATCTVDGLALEMAGSVSISGPLRMRSDEVIPWADLKAVRSRRSLLAPWKVTLRFTSRVLRAFEAFPAATGYILEVKSMTSGDALKRFLVDANLAIEEGMAEGLQQKIEDALEQ